MSSENETTDPAHESETKSSETFTHPKTGHVARAYKDEWARPTAITIEVAHSKYPGEEHYLMAEMVGVVMLPDGQAKIWAQVTDGLSIPKAIQNAADTLKALWDECQHDDEPGVPHCYCKPNTEAFAPELGVDCCRCDASAPDEYFIPEEEERIALHQARAKARSLGSPPDEDVADLKDTPAEDVLGQ